MKFDFLTKNPKVIISQKAFLIINDLAVFSWLEIVSLAPRDVTSFKSED